MLDYVPASFLAGFLIAILATSFYGWLTTLRREGGER